MDDDGESQGKVKVVNVFVSGLDALVALQFQPKTDATQITFMVAMRLEDHDWRINDFGQWMKADLHLAQLAHQPTQIEKNEAAAQENLGKILVAVFNYGNQHPSAGFPSRLAVLTGHTGQSPAEEQAGVLDALFAAEPLIIGGYQFSYTLTRSGSGPVPVTVRVPGSNDVAEFTTYVDKGEFQIVVTPVEFGKTGTRSFFANSRGKITATSEDRPATEDDPALSDGGSVVVED